MSQPHSVFPDFFAPSPAPDPDWREERTKERWGSGRISPAGLRQSRVTVLFKNSRSSVVSRSFYKKCCIKFSPSRC